jgi:Tfp pilus assembly protein PilX
MQSMLRKGVLLRIVMTLFVLALIVIRTINTTNTWVSITGETWPHALAFQIVQGALWMALCVWIIWWFFPLDSDT